MFRPCWNKNGHIYCDYGCYRIKEADKIANQQEGEVIKTCCNPLMPLFIDKVRSEIEAIQKLKSS